MQPQEYIKYNLTKRGPHIALCFIGCAARMQPTAYTSYQLELERGPHIALGFIGCAARMQPQECSKYNFK